MMSPSEPGNYRDELDLVDLWLAIQRNFRLILAFMIGGLLVGLALVFLLPRELEHKVVLEIGGVWIGGSTLSSAAANQFQFVEQPESVVARIEDSYALEAALQFPEIDDELVDGLKAKETKNGHLVEVAITAPERMQAEATAFVSNTAARVLEAHNTTLEKRVELLRSVARERLADLDMQLEALRKSRAQMSAEEGAAAVGLALLLVDTQIQRISSERNSVERELKVELEVNLRPTRVLAGPITDAAGLGPVFLVLVSLMVAGFLAVVALIFVELGAAAGRRGK